MSEIIPKEWSSKTGIPYTELVANFNKNIQMLKQLHPEKDDKSLTMQARFMVYTQIKSRMYIRAQPFDVIWVG